MYMFEGCNLYYNNMCDTVDVFCFDRLDGIKDLMERRRMEQYLSQHPDQGKDDTILCTIQGE